MTHPMNGWSSPRLSDEELDYYGDLYVRWRIRKCGVDFETFLNNPEYYLQKYAQGPWRSGEDEGDNGRVSSHSNLPFRQPTSSPSD